MALNAGGVSSSSSGYILAPPSYNSCAPLFIKAVGFLSGGSLSQKNLCWRAPKNWSPPGGPPKKKGFPPPKRVVHTPGGPSQRVLETPPCGPRGTPFLREENSRKFPRKPIALKRRPKYSHIMTSCPRNGGLKG